jgi:hypothetical protein
MSIVNPQPNTPSPRVLLSIDYESWFALSRRYDRIPSTEKRRALDAGYSQHALDILLEMLGEAKASFFMVGEIVEWYPEVPEKIAAAGHELGFHCHIHRPLHRPADLQEDLRRSKDWLTLYDVRGYRAPMVRISEDAYPLLAQAGFRYSSSIYAPAGSLVQKSGVWELPVSTLRLFRGHPVLNAPRRLSMGLVFGGEIPYGSSLTVGLLGNLVLRILELELRAGRSPVIFLHPYELVHPENWPSRLGTDLLTNPLLLPFTVDKSGYLKNLLRAFPVSPLGTWLDETLALRGGNHAP